MLTSHEDFIDALQTANKSNGKLAIIKKCLRENFELNESYLEIDRNNEYVYSPLGIAVKALNADVVDLLLSLKAKIEVPAMSIRGELGEVLAFQMLLVNDRNSEDYDRDYDKYIRLIDLFVNAQPPSSSLEEWQNEYLHKHLNYILQNIKNDRILAYVVQKLKSNNIMSYPLHDTFKHPLGTGGLMMMMIAIAQLVGNFRKLINAGVDINQIDNDGNTIMDLVLASYNVNLNHPHKEELAPQYLRIIKMLVSRKDFNPMTLLNSDGKFKHNLDADPQVYQIFSESISNHELLPTLDEQHRSEKSRLHNTPNDIIEYYLKPMVLDKRGAVELDIKKKHNRKSAAPIPAASSASANSHRFMQPHPAHGSSLPKLDINDIDKLLNPKSLEELKSNTKKLSTISNALSKDKQQDPRSNEALRKIAEFEANATGYLKTLISNIKEAFNTYGSKRASFLPASMSKSAELRALLADINLDRLNLQQLITSAQHIELYLLKFPETDPIRKKLLPLLQAEIDLGISSVSAAAASPSRKK